MECTHWWATHFSEDFRVHDIGHLKVHLVIRRKDLNILDTCSRSLSPVGLM